MNCLILSIHAGNNRHHFRAEKEKLNEKMKEGHQQEEVDDSGFYAGEITHRAVQ